MPSSAAARDRRWALKRIGCIVLAIMALLLAAPAAAWADECPAGGQHDYVVQFAQPATDNAEGLRVFVCSKCGDTVEQVVPPTGHDWGPWIVDVAPTCTTEGLEHRECVKHAGELHREERLIEPLSVTGEHSWAETSRLDPTCEAPGVAYLRCQVCGETTEEALGALGHEWGEWQVVREATADEEGLERRTCIHDESHVEERAVPVLAVESHDLQEEAPAPGASDAEPHDAEPPVAEPQPEPETEPLQQPDPWAPNQLDAVLLGADVVVIGVFAFAALPLVHAALWAAARRRRAQEGLSVEANVKRGGRVL